jgi:hypothetical protein
MMRPNPKRLNPLQLRTLTLLQALARERAFAYPPERDGAVLIHTLPHPHGDHFHVGPAVVSVLACPYGRGARLRHGDRRRDPAQR